MYNLRSKPLYTPYPPYDTYGAFSFDFGRVPQRAKRHRPFGCRPRPGKSDSTRKQISVHLLNKSGQLWTLVAVRIHRCFQSNDSRTCYLLQFENILLEIKLY